VDLVDKQAGAAAGCEWGERFASTMNFETCKKPCSKEWIPKDKGKCFLPKRTRWRARLLAWRGIGELPKSSGRPKTLMSPPYNRAAYISRRC
jgi:hypothetical protein